MATQHFKRVKRLGRPAALAAVSLTALASGVSLSSVTAVVGGMATEFIGAAFDRVSRKRIAQLDDAMKSQHGIVTSAMLEDDEAVHAIVVTMRAVARESQSEKIAAFARLLIAAGIQKSVAVDTFDEFAQILENLSAREITALVEIDEIERANANLQGNDVQRANVYWQSLRDQLEAIGIPKAEQRGVLARLARTGLYVELTGSYTGYAGGFGVLTGLWPRFRYYVIDRDLDQREAAQREP